MACGIPGQGEMPTNWGQDEAAQLTETSAHTGLFIFEQLLQYYLVEGFFR